MKANIKDTIANQLGEFIENATFDQIDDNTLWRGKMCILDMLGVSMAAWSEESTQLLFNWLQKYGYAQESSVLGGGMKLPAANAAMLNSMMAHSLELEDHHSHKRSLNHPGVCTIPPALAIAEREGKTGRNFLTAVILGYEIGSRISAATKLGTLNLDRGFHESSVVGPFSAATVTAKLMNLPAEKIAQAFGICGSLAAGSMEFKSSEAWSKRLQVGNASRNGIMAAELASDGFTGPPTVFEGKHGFYHSYVHDGNYDLSKITRELGKHWDINHIIYKPFACAGVLHSAVTAAGQARKLYGINHEEIEHVVIRTASKIIQEYAVPPVLKTAPQTTVGAQFSLQYSVAVMLVTGKALLEQFSSEAIQDPRVLRIAKLITPQVDANIDQSWPQVDPSEILITLRSGHEIKVRVEEAKGDLLNPVTDNELKVKFKELTAPFLTSARAEQVILLCENLDEVGDICRLSELLVRNR